MSIEISQLLSALGIILSFTVGFSGLIISIQNSKKTAYINTVTRLRSEWLYNVKGYFSEFITNSIYFIDNYSHINSENKNEIIKKLYYYQYLLKFNLNPNDKYDNVIIKKLGEIITRFISIRAIINRTDSICSDIEKLTELASSLNKFEWEGIKKESQIGILRENEKEALRKKYLDPYFGPLMVREESPSASLPREIVDEEPGKTST